jgi:hypothetical protein
MMTDGPHPQSGDLRPDAAPVADRRRFLRAAGGAVAGGGFGAAALGGAAAAGGAPGSGDDGPWGADLQVPDLAEDPTGALQDAMAAAARAGGGTVFVAPGRHEIADHLELRDNVTLRGASRTRTVLAMGGADVVHVPAVEGAAIEDLTIDGAGTGVRYRRGGRFCTLRRLLVARSIDTGVAFEGGGYRHIAMDDLRIDLSGGHGMDLAATERCDSIFVTGLVVGAFGVAGGAGNYGLRVTGRCHLNQIQIDPVHQGAVAVGFESGSEHTTLSNYYLGLGGGRAFEGAERAEIGVGTHQELHR